MQHEIKIGDKTILMVGVDDNAKNIRINGFGNLHYESPFKQIIFLTDNYKLIGTYPGIIEEQAAEIVESIGIGYYNNYKPLPINLKSALESFTSLMEANEIFTINPYGERPDWYSNEDFGQGNRFYDEEDFDNQLSAWNRKQERTSPMWVILEKVK